MTELPNNLISDPQLLAQLKKVAEALPAPGVCEVCGETDSTVGSVYCEELPLLQMCEHCHWMQCPEGGACV
ncbi:MAG: hypothetical protein H6526_00800 [Actinobacteria bacterium]|nr:hypothetical protein [Actinomycetota bacterium]MCB9413802.1 hypothetical protein [Actinomycetota bacterium]